MTDQLTTRAAEPFDDDVSQRCAPARTACWVRAFGLTLQSCVPLPAPAATAGATPDVDIRYGPVATDLPHAVSRRGRHQAAPGEWLLTVEDVGRFHVSEGRRVTIDRCAGASDADVRLFLLGSTLGAVFHQRADLVLHGSAVEASGSAVGFLGASGSGKSTLAAALHQRGYPSLTDDLCVVRAGDHGVMEAQPGLPYFKLWMDALERLDVPATSLARVGAGLDKRALPTTGFADGARPLTHLYLLEPADVARVSLRVLEGAEKFQALAGHTYRLRYVDGLGVTARHFRHVVSVAGQAKVTVVQRPRGSYQLDALIDALVDDFGIPAARHS
jgi:hypothetical protein